MGKSTISMAIFHSTMLVHQGVTNLGPSTALQSPGDDGLHVRSRTRSPEGSREGQRPREFHHSHPQSEAEVTNPMDPMGLKMGLSENVGLIFPMK